MSVEVLGEAAGGNGHEDSVATFRSSHLETSHVLVNLAQGRKKNAPSVPYDPAHPDNQFPVMLYHPAKGDKKFGISLKGLSGSARADAEKANAAAVNGAKADGYRAEPYSKPQVVVLDPAAEKKALLDKNQELEGKIAVLADSFAKLLKQQEAAAAAPLKK